MMIEMQQVTMQFGAKVVLKKVSLKVQPGEIIGLVGANGAGKTTLINLILGRLQPTSGQISVLQAAPSEKRHFNRIGAMLQDDSRIARLKVSEELTMVGQYYQQPLPVATLLKMADLTEQANQMVNQLSGGQLRRMTFALAMAGDPDLIFLDEPTVGMDVTSRQHFWQQIDQLKQAGKTIILTSHYLEEIEKVATRILILKDGQFQYDGDFQTLQQQYRSSQIQFKTDESMANLQDWPEVLAYQEHAHRISLQVTNSDVVLARLSPQIGQTIHQVQVQAGSLTDIYNEIMGADTDAIINGSK